MLGQYGIKNVRNIKGVEKRTSFLYEVGELGEEIEGRGTLRVDSDIIGRTHFLPATTDKQPRELPRVTLLATGLMLGASVYDRVYIEGVGYQESQTTNLVPFIESDDLKAPGWAHRVAARGILQLVNGSTVPAIGQQEIRGDLIARAFPDSIH